MRFINRENNLSAKFFNVGFVFLLIGSCLLSVACQTKEQKTAAALQRCQELLDKGELQNIGDCYNAAIRADPDNAAEISKAGKTAFFKKCVDCKEKEDYQNAIICLEGFTELEPKMANSYFLLADSYYRYYQERAKATGKPDADFLDRAEDSIKTGLSIKPEDAAAHSLYGQISADKNDKTKSLMEHQMATAISPKTYIFWLYYLISQEKFGEDEEAIKSCRQALALKPDDPLVTNLLGKLYVKIGKNDEAIETFEKLLKFQPDYDEEVKRKLEELKRLRDEKKPKAKAVGRQ